jgi:dephospho-CoA kinase
MLRVGLTGGLASGKSTVAAYLKELGAVVFDADEIVADLYRPGAEGAKAAAELFGAAILGSDGRADHSRIAAVVFGDPGKRRATDVLVNDGTLEDLRGKVEVLYRSWLEKAAEP